MICSYCLQGGNLKLRRCGRCKHAYYCSVEHQRRDLSSHKRVCFAPLSNPAKIKELLPSLKENGYMCLYIEGIDEMMDLAWSEIRSVFAESAASKNGLRCEPEAVGPGLRYLTPFPGLHELLEMREEFQKEMDSCGRTLDVTWKLFVLLRRLAIDVLAMITADSSETGGANSADRSSLRWDRRWRSGSTLRALAYDRIAPTRDMTLAGISAHFPAHVDSSLVTVAPRSTLPALEVRSFDTMEWHCIEDDMPANSLLIFIGECGSYLTNNNYPAALHRPSVQLMNDRAEENPRLSTPLFLRADDKVPLVPPKHSGLPTIPVGVISKNINGFRDKLPWKQGKMKAYYDQEMYSE